MNIGKFLGFGVAVSFVVLVVAAGLNLILAVIAQACWNYFCEALHLPPLGYWQMWTLLVFLSIIAGIFRNNVQVKND